MIIIANLIGGHFCEDANECNGPRFQIIRNTVLKFGLKNNLR